MSGSNKWRVRKLRITDHHGLRSFKCANPGQSWTQDVENMIRNDLYKSWGGSNSPELSVYVVASSNDSALLGVVACSVNWKETPYGHIPLLAVHPDHRRQRIATELKQAAIDSLLGNGCTAVASEVHTLNLPMQAVNKLFAPEVGGHPDAADYLFTIVRFDDS